MLNFLLKLFYGILIASGILVIVIFVSQIIVMFITNIPTFSEPSEQLVGVSETENISEIENVSETELLQTDFQDLIEKCRRERNFSEIQKILKD